MILSPLEIVVRHSPILAARGASPQSLSAVGGLCEVASSAPSAPAALLEPGRGNAAVVFRLRHGNQAALPQKLRKARHIRESAAVGEFGLIPDKS